MLSPLRLEIDPLTTDSSPDWFIDEDYIKAHLHIDFGDDDEYLQFAVRAGIEWAENATQRTIARRGHTLVLKCFPESCYQSIWLPRGRTVSIERIAYSLNGVELELTGPSSSPPGDDYQEDLRGDSGALIMPARGGVWPSHDYDVPAPVVIEFTAGWSASELPPALLQAVLLAVSDCYDLRGSADYAAANLVDRGASLLVRQALISPYLLSRWF